MDQSHIYVFTFIRNFLSCQTAHQANQSISRYFQSNNFLFRCIPFILSLKAKIYWCHVIRQLLFWKLLEIFFFSFFCPILGEYIFKYQSIHELVLIYKSLRLFFQFSDPFLFILVELLNLPVILFSESLLSCIKQIIWCCPLNIVQAGQGAGDELLVTGVVVEFSIYF